MHVRASIVAAALLVPAALTAQSPAAPAQSADGVVYSFERFADIYGSQLVAAFDSIPASRYGYRPTPVQRSIGDIAQHLERANYGLCERLGALKYTRTAKDSLADSVKARWPKDTLVRRLERSLRFCDSAIEQLTQVQSPAIASTLIGFETDLAEHYSQLASYMRILGLVPPTALPLRRRTAIELPATAIAQYPGVYQIAHGYELEVTSNNGALFAKSNMGGPALHLWPESNTEFFVNEADAQITFTRDASGAVTGLVLHQYMRDRPATKIH